MNLHDYQGAINDFARYPEVHSARYTAMGLFGEVGEIANQVKKIWRDDAGQPTPAKLEKLRDELGDVLWYATRWSHHQGFIVGSLTIEIGVGIANMDIEPAKDIFEATEHLELLAATATAFTLLGGEGQTFDYVQALFNTIATMADFLETDIEEIAQANVDKLTGRVERGTLQGSGDGR